MKKLLFTVAILAIAALLAYIIFNNRHYFSRREIRIISSDIQSFGVLAPLALVALIFISNAVPPLPIPTPLVEIAAGFIFGFWPAFILVWVAQIISSLFDFGITRFFGRRYFKFILDNKIWNPYKEYLNQKGSQAVFIVRATLAAPFNIISFLAGLTQMKTGSFAIATTLGTIPEVTLFVLVGSNLRNLHIRLWYLFILITLIGTAGSIITFILLRLFVRNLKAEN